MKNLNESIDLYTTYLKEGKIQVAYKGIFDFLGKLRSALSKAHPDYEVSGIYPGYMDMSYIAVITEALKEKSLKIAVVYLHEKGSFEVWLSAKNRDIAKHYAAIIDCHVTSGLTLFHDSDNLDAIVECSLTTKPNFEDQSSLIATIDRGVEKFLSLIIGYL